MDPVKVTTFLLYTISPTPSSAITYLKIILLSRKATNLSALTFAEEIFFKGHYYSARGRKRDPALKEAGGGRVVGPLKSRQLFKPREKFSTGSAERDKATTVFVEITTKKERLTT